MLYLTKIFSNTFYKIKLDKSTASTSTIVLIFIKVMSWKVFQNCVTDSTDTVGFSDGFCTAGATGVFLPSQPSKLGNGQNFLLSVQENLQGRRIGSVRSPKAAHPDVLSLTVVAQIIYFVPNLSHSGCVGVHLQVASQGQQQFKHCISPSSPPRQPRSPAGAITAFWLCQVARRSLP